MRLRICRVKVSELNKVGLVPFRAVYHPLLDNTVPLLNYCFNVIVASRETGESVRKSIINQAAATRRLTTTLAKELVFLNPRMS